MKLLLSCLVALVLVPAAAAQTPPVTYKDLESFKKNGTGELWRSVMVSPKIKRDELIALAKFLRGKYPDTPIRIFTDDERFEEFKQWDIHYPSDAYPPPREWLRKHNMAKIQPFSTDGGRTWRWRLWAVSSASYKFAPDGGDVIAEL